MLLTLFLLTLTFFVTTLFGYGAHWALHQKWFGKFHQSHMTHHLKLYPATDFFSESYRNAGKDSTFWFFLFAGAPLVAVPIVLFFFGKLGLIATLLIVAEAVVIGLFNNWLHDAFHLKDHWLNFFGWFKKLVKLHMTHHVNMEKNYGIFFFLWDKLFKTMRDNDNI